MGSVYVTEYAELGIGKNGQVVQAGVEPALTTQKLTSSGTSLASSAFNAKTRFVRVHTDAIISILFGSSPTATTSTARMGAGQTEYFAVNPGDKIAVITNT